MRTARLRKPAESPRPAGLFSCGKRSSKKPVDFTSQPYFTQAAAGSYQQETQTKLWQLNRLYEYDTPTYFSIMVHELGHAFGLGDEYLEDRPHNYASATPGQGIMSRIYSPISCDELDGMITLLDRFSGKQRSFASFCAPTVVLESGESVPAAEELQKQLKKTTAICSRRTLKHGRKPTPAGTINKRLIQFFTSAKPVSFL